MICARRLILPSFLVTVVVTVGFVGALGLTGIGVAAAGVRGAGFFFLAGAVSSVAGLFTYVVAWPTFFSPAGYGTLRFVLERIGGACVAGAFLGCGLALAYYVAGFRAGAPART